MDLIAFSLNISRSLYTAGNMQTKSSLNINQQCTTEMSEDIEGILYESIQN